MEGRCDEGGSVAATKEEEEEEEEKKERARAVFFRPRGCPFCCDVERANKASQRKNPLLTFAQNILSPTPRVCLSVSVSL